MDQSTTRQGSGGDNETISDTRHERETEEFAGENQLVTNSSSPTPTLTSWVGSNQTMMDSLQNGISRMLQTPNDKNTRLKPEHLLAKTPSINPMTKDILHVGRLEEFAFFPRLPFELRAAVWECMLPGPRIVEVFQQQEDSARDHANGICRPGTFLNSSLPIAMHVCQESRKVALFKYKLLAIGPWHDPEEHDGDAKSFMSHVRIDPRHDTVYLTWHKRLAHRDETLKGKLMSGQFWTSETFEKLELLAVDSELWLQHQGAHEYVKKFRLGHFKNLKVLTIVLHADKYLQGDAGPCPDSGRMRKGDLEFIEPRKHGSEKKWEKLWSIGIGKRFKRELAAGQLTLPHIPTIKIMFATRGGQRCCRWDIEDKPDDDSEDDDSEDDTSRDLDIDSEGDLHSS